VEEKVDRRRRDLVLAAAAVFTVVIAAGCVSETSGDAAVERTAPATAALEREDRPTRQLWMYRFQPPRPKAAISESASAARRPACG